MASAATDPAEPPMPTTRHIANPRRLLILTPPSQSSSVIPPFLHALTGTPVHNPPSQYQPAETTPPSSPSPPFPSTGPHTPSFAGYTTHAPLHLQTKYYTAEVNVWVDEVPISTEKPATPGAPVPADINAPRNTPSQTQTKPGQWRTEFLSDEASIVRDAIGALIVCVHRPDPPPTTQIHSDPASQADIRALLDLMRDVGAVKERIDEERGGMGDVSGILVLEGAKKSAAPVAQRNHEMDLALSDDKPEGGFEDGPYSVAWWEDQLYDLGLLGWEVIEWDARGQDDVKTRNTFGELEGMRRIKEALETHDWSASSNSVHDPGADIDAAADFDDDLESELLGVGRSSHTRGFGQEVHELEREMFGLRMAIERGGDGADDSGSDNGVGFGDDDEEIKVESMEALMMRVQAIRDMSADLPESERKKFAAKAVSDIMREM